MEFGSCWGHPGAFMRRKVDGWSDELTTLMQPTIRRKFLKIWVSRLQGPHKAYSLTVSWGKISNIMGTLTIRSCLVLEHSGFDAFDALTCLT